MRPASPCVMRTPARHLASTLAVRRIGNTLPMRMTDTTCAAGTSRQATPAARSDSPFVSMSLHAADAFVVLAKFVCASGTGSTARHVPCGANRSGKSVSASHGRQRGAQWWGNVSGTYPYPARRAERRDWRNCASIAQRLWIEAGRPSAHARRHDDQSCAEEYVGKALQKCDLWPGARDADARSCVTRQGEYRCVRIHLSEPGTDAIREPIGISARVVDDFRKGWRAISARKTTDRSDTVVRMNLPLRRAATTHTHRKHSTAAR